MPRCLHIYASGFQCVDETAPDSDFCVDHVDLRTLDRLEDEAWRKMFRRFVAFVLLIAFLIPLLYSLRNLYGGPPSVPVEAR